MTAIQTDRKIDHMDQPDGSSGTAQRVAARVAHLIKDCGVTTTWLCERTGIPRSTMNRHLGGHSAFNLDQIDRIAKAIRVPVRDLLDIEAAA